MSIFSREEESEKPLTSGFEQSLGNDNFRYMKFIVDGHSLELLDSMIEREITQYPNFFHYILSERSVAEKIAYFRRVPAEKLQSARDELGNNLLHIIAQKREYDPITVCLLNAGVDPALVNQEGFTPLTYLLQNNSKWLNFIKLTEWLLSRDSQKSCLFEGLSQTGILDFNNEIADDEEQDNYKKMSAIILAENNSNQQLVPVNITGALGFLNDTFNSKELNERISKNRKSLRASFDTLVDLINENDYERRNELFGRILAVADINYADENGDTLLHHAMRAKNIRAVCKILEKRPNISLLNRQNKKVWDMFVFSNEYEAQTAFNNILDTAVEIPAQDIMKSLFEYGAKNKIYPENTNVLTSLLMKVFTANLIADRQPYIKLLDFLFKNTKALLKWFLSDFNFSEYRDTADESGVIIKSAFLNTLSNNCLDNIEKHVVITYCLAHMENRLKLDRGLAMPEAYALNPALDFFQEGFHALDFIPYLDKDTISAIFKKFPIADWFSTMGSPEAECRVFLQNLFDKEDISAYKRVAEVLRDSEFSAGIIENIEYSKAGLEKLKVSAPHSDNNIIQSSDNNLIQENDLIDLEGNTQYELPGENNHGYGMDLGGENNFIPQVAVINEFFQSPNEQNIHIISDAPNSNTDDLQIEENKQVEEKNQDKDNQHANRLSGVKRKVYQGNRYTFLAKEDLQQNKRRKTSSQPSDKWSCNIL